MADVPWVTPAVGERFTINGQERLARMLSGHIVADNIGSTGTTTPGTDDTMDYEELFAELTAGAYGFPTTLMNGNLQFDNVRGTTAFFIIFLTNGNIELREGTETGTLRLTVS